MSDILAGLNDEQRRVVTHTSGPLLVLAGPGSGKTRVITAHIAYRVRERRTPPERILGITFTNRAADEMRRRLRALLTEDAPVPLGTFHWMCTGFLRRFAARDERGRDFRLLSPGESRALLGTIVPQTGKVGAFARALSAVKNGASEDEAARIHAVSRHDLRAARAEYDRRTRALNALDLDDLLVRTVELLRDDSAVRNAARRRFDLILVDEFQDTNPVQAEIVRLLAPPDDTVIAVGDDDQAIYEWRQAGGGATLFMAAFPRAETVVLGESYRHSKQILRAAATLIEHNTQRSPKKLWTRRPAGQRPFSFVARDEIDEAEWIAGKIDTLVSDGVPYSDIAVLYRVHAQSRAIEDALVRHGVPYRILAGARFYAQPEIQRVLAYLRLALDRGDDEAAAILAAGVPGIGETRLGLLRDEAGRSGTSLLEALGSTHPGAKIPVPVQERLHSVAARAGVVAQDRERTLHVVAGRAIDAVRQDLEQSVADPAGLTENLDELMSVVREFEAQRGTLRGLIDRLTVHPDVDDGEHGVSMLSLHAAKGLEFSVVFLPGLEEGLLPHRRSMDREKDLEGERRLAYVGMTRARDLLYLSHAHMRFLGGQALVGGASRFLSELGPSSVAVEWSERAVEHRRLPSVRVGERVRHQRWGIGTVLSVEGHGRDTLTTIAFDTVGRQRLQLCHAPLTRLPASEDRSNVG